jgi:hypothetical protein
VKVTLRVVFAAVMAILFLGLSSFRIRVYGCVILWLIDIVRGDSTRHQYDSNGNTILSREAEPDVSGFSM